MTRYFALASLLFSAIVSANSLVLSGSSHDEIQTTIQSAWKCCGEQEWCADNLYYYRDAFIAEAHISPKELSIELLAEYSPFLLSQLQIYLRQDGFNLTKVEIEDRVFDVTTVVAESSLVEADKSLILFLNRYPQSATRTIDWQTELWNAQLASDGELISLKFIRRELE